MMHVDNYLVTCIILYSMLFHNIANVTWYMQLYCSFISGFTVISIKFYILLSVLPIAMYARNIINKYTVSSTTAYEPCSAFWVLVISKTLQKIFHQHGHIISSIRSCDRCKQTPRPQHQEALCSSPSEDHHIGLSHQ